MTAWRERLSQVDAPRLPAAGLYAGDHWKWVLEGYRRTQRYSNRAELWVISAGYGLIPATKAIKPYGATFASGVADSVWRGPPDGDRRACLRDWWALLEHETSLADLLTARKDAAVVLVAGSAYVEAAATEIASARDQDLSGERLSVISAGTRGNGVLVPVDGRFRKAVGGTDSSLNARLLALLAQDAGTHGFRRSAMSKTIAALASKLPPTHRQQGQTATDAEVMDQIETLRRRRPPISRTRALHDLRERGIACEQRRFATLWSALVLEQA
jgi:hypothetical protein